MQIVSQILAVEVELNARQNALSMFLLDHFLPKKHAIRLRVFIPCCVDSKSATSYLRLGKYSNASTGNNRATPHPRPFFAAPPNDTSADFTLSIIDSRL